MSFHKVGIKVSVFDILKKTNSQISTSSETKPMKVEMITNYMNTKLLKAIKSIISMRL